MGTEIVDKIDENKLAHKALHVKPYKIFTFLAIIIP